MKKKNLIYLLLIITLLFSFNHKVYAAQELTCVYKGGLHPSVMLVQNSDGTHKIYKDFDILTAGYSRGTASKIDDPHWAIPTNDLKVNFDSVSDLKKDSDGNLKECPNYRTAFVIYESEKYVYFSDDKKFLNADYELSDSDVKATTITKTKDELTKENEEEAKGYKNGTFGTQVKDTYCLFERNNVSVQLEFDSKEILLSNNLGVDMRIDFSLKDLKLNYCPMDLFVQEVTITDVDPNTYETIGTKISSLNISTKKKNNNFYMFPLKYGNEFEEVKLINESIIIGSCEDIFGGQDDGLISILKTFKNLIFIVVPIIMLVLGTLDMAKAVFAADDSAMKKAQTKFIKRLIICVAIFLVPILLGVLLNIAHSVWPNISSDFCGIL